MADEVRDVFDDLMGNPASGLPLGGAVGTRRPFHMVQDVAAEKAGAPFDPDEYRKEVAPALEKSMPGIDASAYEKHYTGLRKLGAARGAEAQSGEGFGEYVQRRSLPLFTARKKSGEIEDYNQAVKRYQGGQATDEDYQTIAHYERLQQIEQKRGPGEAALGALASVPAIVGEAYAAHKIGKIASKIPGLGWLAPAEGGAAVAAPTIPLLSAGAALGRSALQTLAMPSLYLEQATQNKYEHPERSTLENATNAFALGMLNNAVLGQLSKTAEIPGAGLKYKLARVASTAGLGMVEQQAVDVLANVSGLESGFGLLGDLLEGKGGDAMKRATSQLVTFGAFAAAHDKNPDPVFHAYQETLRSMKSRALSADGAAAKIGKLYETLADALDSNPNLSPAEARKLVEEKVPDPVLRKLGNALADTLPEQAKPSEQKPTGDVRNTVEPRAVERVLADHAAEGGDVAELKKFLDAAGTDIGVRSGQPKPETEVASGGVPEPERGTGLINPVQSGVPGIVSGAVEVPDKPAVSEKPSNGRRLSPAVADEMLSQINRGRPEAPAEPIGHPTLSLADLERLQRQQGGLRRLGESQVADRPTEGEIGRPGASQEAVSPPVGPERPLDAVRRKFMSGRRVEFGEAFDAAGLTEQERHIVRERMDGRTLAEIAEDKELAKPGGGSYTRQRVKQMEQAALAKFGHDGSLFDRIIKPTRASNALDRVERGTVTNDEGKRVLAADGTEGLEDAHKQIDRRQAFIDRVDREMQRHIDQWEKEAKDAGGKLDPERQRELAAEYQRLAAKMERGRDGEEAAARHLQGEPAGPADRDQPAPVRRPGGRGVEEGPADAPNPAAGPPVPAGPADTRPAEGLPGGTAAGPPAPAGGGEAAGRELTRSQKAKETRAANREEAARAKAEAVKSAAENGVGEADVHGHAKELRDVAAEARARDDRFASDIDALAPAETKGHLRMIGLERYEDATSIPGFDVLADGIMKRYPEKMNPGEKTTDALFRILKEGRAERLTNEQLETRAYEQATKNLIEQKEIIDRANEQLKRQGQKPFTPEDIAGPSAEAPGHQGPAAEGLPGEAKEGAVARPGRRELGSPLEKVRDLWDRTRNGERIDPSEMDSVFAEMKKSPVADVMAALKEFMPHNKEKTRAQAVDAMRRHVLDLWNAQERSRSLDRRAGDLEGGERPNVETEVEPGVSFTAGNMGTLQATDLAGKTLPNPMNRSEHHAALAERFGRELSDADLPEPQKRQYARNFLKVIGRMNAETAKRVNDNLHEANFFRSADELTGHLADKYAAAKEVLDKGDVIGGAFAKGKLFLDGDADLRSSGGTAETRGQAHELYAHEFGHALDGYTEKGKGVSDTPEWQDAWREELVPSKPIGGYATESAREGFAEFARVLFGMGVDPAELAKRFPKSLKVFADNGLVGTGKEPWSKPAEVFKDAINEGGVHADVLLARNAQNPDSLMGGVHDFLSEESGALNLTRMKEVAGGAYRRVRDALGWGPDELMRDPLHVATALEQKNRARSDWLRKLSAVYSQIRAGAAALGDTASATKYARRSSRSMNQANDLEAATMVGAKNSPLKTEADYQAHLNDPAFQDVMSRNRLQGTMDQAVAAPVDQEGTGRGILRQHNAEKAQRTDRDAESLRQGEKFFQTYIEGQNPAEAKNRFLAFMDAVESGKTDALPADQQEFAKTYRALKDQYTKQLGDRGLVQTFIENHFGHLWDFSKGGDAQATGAAFASKRPLAGKEGFRKERTIPTYREGVDEAGLTPKSWNPLTLAKMEFDQYNRSIFGHDSFEEAKEQGLVKFMPLGKSAPDGWQTIPDKLWRQLRPTDEGLVLKGYQYMPAEVSKLFENHLSEGLGGSKAFRAFREFGGQMSQAILGWSGFHATGTVLNAQFSAISEALHMLSRGDLAEAAWKAPEALIPGWAAVAAVGRGLKARQGWDAPGSATPEGREIAERMQLAGGRARAGSEYFGTQTDLWTKAARQLAGGDFGKIPEVLLRALPALNQLVSKPIMEQLVPLVKMGVFADAARYELSKMPGADVNAKRAALGKIQDAMDDRFGQIVHDNLFLNRTLRDVLHTGFLSFGWNLGDVRGLGGGLADTFKPSQWSGLARGEGLSRRTAFLLSMMAGTGLYAALYQSLAGGGPMSGPKDYFFPKTGRQNDDGSDERISLPTYMKDIAQVANRAGDSPLQVPRNLYHAATGKIAPAVRLLGEILTNEDWQGRAIENPNDPLAKQAKDTALHILKAFVPISADKFMQARGKGEGLTQQLQGFVGLTPAPSRITHTDEELREAEAKRKVYLTPLGKKLKSDPDTEGFAEPKPKRRRFGYR